MPATHDNLTKVISVEVCAFLIVMTFALPAGSNNGRKQIKRPNILFALSDDQSYPHTSILGDPVVKTPAFNRIAREGILFTNSFAACPSCTPSRSAILTGRQIWQVGEAGVLFGTLHPRYPLFTHLLEDAGYHVGFVGKPWAPGDWRAAGLTRHPNGKEYSVESTHGH
ncbi:MAG: sulfatase-like hydrolase/transferase [Pirellulales bacterium]